MNVTTELPTTHATRRSQGHEVRSREMIGRLVNSEFDRLDAIVANMRIGITPTLRAIATSPRKHEPLVATRSRNGGKLRPCCNAANWLTERTAPRSNPAKTSSLLYLTCSVADRHASGFMMLAA
jgi:hypothetical protein